MPKTLKDKRTHIKNNKKSPQRISNKITEASFYFFSTLSFVFFVYFFSIFREWQTFDERSFHNENLFPIPVSFSEIPEVINTFVFNYHTESMNTFFSKMITLRSNQLASILIVFVSYFFKKSALSYHILQLGIHLINSALVWIIFNRTTRFFIEKATKSSLLLVSLLTALWAVHSANTEAILLVTNWDTILTYTACLGFLLYETSSLYMQEKGKLQKTNFFLVSILFCLLMLFTEYSYSLPLIVFFIVLGLNYKQNSDFKFSLKTSLERTKPYIFGLFLFVLFSLGKADSPLVNLFSSSEAVSLKISPVYAFLERNLWLTPQIFVHNLKLLLFPKTLSTYQSNLIHLSSKLFEPYSILCSVIYVLFLVTPFISFIVLKRKPFSFLFLLIYGFYFALFPFLHILLPTYCLSADRYCYFPSFVLIFFLFSLLCQVSNLSSPSIPKSLVITLSCIIFLFTIRTLIRIQDWNNSYSLYKSALKSEKNLLYKGQKLIVFADFVGAQGKQEEMENSLQESLSNLKKALKDLKKLRKENSVQPATLKIYGLDYNSLILKAAYAISTIRNDNYQEPVNEVLKFFEPYIKGRLYLGGINQITFYADLLLKAGRSEDAINTLEYGLKLYPYSSSIILSLADLYLNFKSDSEKSYEMLQKAYKYFPNDRLTIFKLLKFYEGKKDLENEAKFSYLLGLREHSVKSYQRAVQIYLDLNQLAPAHKTLKKLAKLDSNDPLTLLLTSRYLDLIGKREQIPGILKNAYAISKSRGELEDINVTKSILVSLINVTSHLGNIEDSKKYLNDFEQIKNLTQEDRELIKAIKNNLSSSVSFPRMRESREK